MFRVIYMFNLMLKPRFSAGKIPTTEGHELFLLESVRMNVAEITSVHSTQQLRPSAYAIPSALE